MFRKSLLIAFLSATVLIMSCHGFQSLMKNGTPEEKLVAAEKYFQKADYYHAIMLYDELIVLYRGDAKIRDIYFNYAYSHFYEKDYSLASYHFKYYAKTFPSSEKAEEALYMSAYCKFKESPSFKNDQESTTTAINEMQSFINLYPESKKVEEANKIIDELRTKLVKKDYEKAYSYYKTEFYTSAIYALKQHTQDYPGSPYTEVALLHVIKANYYYAKKSVSDKKLERFKNTVIAYNDYKAKFTEGEYAREASRFLRMAQAEIEGLEINSNSK